MAEENKGAKLPAGVVAINEIDPQQDNDRTVLLPSPPTASPSSSPDSSPRTNSRITSGSEDDREAKRKESSDSGTEQHTKTTRVALLKKTAAPQGIVLAGKLSNCSLLIAVCLPEDHREFKVDEFVTNILQPILQANRPFQLTTVHLVLGSITTDRSTQELCVETEQDRACENYFREAIERGVVPIKRRKIEINVLPWSELASKPGYRDLYKYVQHVFSHDDEVRNAFLEDAQEYLGRRYSEGSEADAFIQWYIKEICKSGFENERADEKFPENAQFMSVCGQSIQKNNAVSQILQWQKDGVYEQDEDQTYLDAPIEEIDIDLEKMSKIVAKYWDERSPDITPDLRAVQSAVEKVLTVKSVTEIVMGYFPTTREDIAEVAWTFSTTVRHVMRETAGLLALGDIAQLSTSYCRDQINRPWLKAMEIIWKKNKGPCLITEQINVKITERTDPRKTKADRETTRHPAKNNSSPPASPPQPTLKPGASDSSEEKLDFSPPSPMLVPTGPPNAADVLQHALKTRQMKIVSHAMWTATMSLVNIETNQSPDSDEIRTNLLEMIWYGSQLLLCTPAPKSTFPTPTLTTYGAPLGEEAMKGLTATAGLLRNSPSRAQPHGLAQKTLPPIQQQSADTAASLADPLATGM